MEYVCTGATLKCTMGTATSILKATPKNVTLVGNDQANIADHISMANIPSFGRCRSLAYPPTASATAANHGRLTPMPCVPGTCTKWQAIDDNSLVCGEPALLRPATVGCMYGGTISIINPGQFLEIKKGGVSSETIKKLFQSLEQEVPLELQEKLKDASNNELSSKSVLDGFQFALSVAGFVPVFGAVPDLINATIYAVRGDWLNAGISVLSAVPGVGDIAGGAKITLNATKAASSMKFGKKIEKTFEEALKLNKTEWKIGQTGLKGVKKTYSNTTSVVSFMNSDDNKAQ